MILGSGSSPGEGIGSSLQISWASLVAQMVKNPPAMGETQGSIPGLGRFPEGGHGNPLQSSCLEKSHGQRSLGGYSPWGHKKSDTTEHSTEQKERSSTRESKKRWQEVKKNTYQSATNLSGILASHGSPQRPITFFNSSAPISYEAMSL